MVIALAPALAPTGISDDLNHVYCCDPDTALCGTDISGYDFTEFDEPSCLVCADLENADTPCARCGTAVPR